MNQRKHPIALAATCAAALLLVACGARPPHAALEQARQAVNQAAATPAVAESAALDLKAASRSIEMILTQNSPLSSAAQASAACFLPANSAEIGRAHV